MKLKIIVLFIALFFAGCSSTATGTRDEIKKKSRTESYIITAEEIKQCSADNAYDVIRILRPNLLRTLQAAIVIYNGQRMGGLDNLYNISVHSIGKIEYLHPFDATMRYGTGFGGGALLITTSRNK